MNDYVEVRIDLTPCNEDMTDLLAAVLADAGFESFVPDSSGLLAYIRLQDYDGSMRDLLRELPFECSATWNATVIEGRDWNHEWEKNYFQPIVIDGRCVVHSSFHSDVPECDHDIVIDPKMAFGTGHHATTWLMMSRLLDMELDGKSVIDMGTGTGILSILSAMLGASPVTGIEIDEGAYLNALENVKLNGCGDAVTLINGDASALGAVGYEADLFLANINRNVITGDIDRYAAKIKNGGTVLFSGFYTEDVAVIEQAAAAHGLSAVDVTSRDNWACVRMIKNPAPGRPL